MKFTKVIDAHSCTKW